MTLPSYATGDGETKSLSSGKVQKLVLENDLGQVLDLSTSFEDQSIELSRSRNNIIAIIPNRTDHHYSGGVNLPITMTFTVPVYSLKTNDVYNQAQQIENWFRESPGNRAKKIYWMYDTGTDDYFYLPNCYWSGFSHRIRSGKRFREISEIEISVESTSSRWYLLWNGVGDTDLSQVIRGTGIVRPSTNDGSAVLMVIRESDEQPLLVATDQGDLLTHGSVKTHQEKAIMQQYEVPIP